MILISSQGLCEEDDCRCTREQEASTSGVEKGFFRLKIAVIRFSALKNLPPAAKSAWAAGLFLEGRNNWQL